MFTRLSSGTPIHSATLHSPLAQAERQILQAQCDKIYILTDGGGISNDESIGYLQIIGRREMTR